MNFMKKTCCRCKSKLPLNKKMFGFDKNGNPRPRCRACEREVAEVTRNKKRDSCACGKAKDKRADKCRGCFLEEARSEDPKKCSGCKKRKPLTEFSFRRNGTAPRSRCKECGAKYAKAYVNKKSPGEKKAYRKKHREREKKNNAEGLRLQGVRRRFRSKGAKEEELSALVDIHERTKACMICKTPEKKAGTMHVDHCHETGEIRGLICRPCNHALGHMKDDPKRLRAAARYLEKPPMRKLIEIETGIGPVCAGK